MCRTSKTKPSFVTSAIRLPEAWRTLLGCIVYLVTPTASEPLDPQRHHLGKAVMMTLASRVSISSTTEVE